MLFRSGRIRLPRGAPLIGVDFVKYTDSDGLQTTWPSTNYLANEHGEIVPIFGQTYPSYIPAPLASVLIRYTSGASNSSPAQFPSESIKHVIALIVGAMYERREAEGIADRASASALASKYGADLFLARAQRQYEF